MSVEAPELYMRMFFYERRRLAELLSRSGRLEEARELVVRNALLLSPMVATCGPAGPNVAPFMVTFLPRREHIERLLKELEHISREYWGQGARAYVAASRFLLENVYNPELVDPLMLGSHLMSRGHTYQNITATGKATLGVLLPPDEGALELRATVWIEEEGLYYRYINMLHDLMHVVPRGERSHPWYPAVIFRVDEVYDNSYHSLGKLVWRRS